METAVYDVKGQETGKMNLPAVFETKVSSALLHEVTTGLLANRRSGTASTKTRGNVSGGGRKPWREKGTGNARAGSIRSPLWRKGGIIFGPQPRDYYQRIPQQKRRMAAAMALAVKAKEGDLVVIDAVTVAEPKTKLVAGLLKNLKIGGRTVLLVVDKAEKSLKTAARNIPGLVVQEAKNVNAYELLWAKKVVVSKPAVEILSALAK